MNATPTLYERAGGEAAIRRLMDCFYDRVERDELLSPYFPGGVSEEHRGHVSIWWSEVLAGPARYTKDLGGYEKTLAHHRGLAIAPEERHRFVSLLSFAADAGLPTTPSSARRSSPTPRGAPGLRCKTPPAERPGLRARTRPPAGAGGNAPVPTLGTPSRSSIAPASRRPPSGVSCRRRRTPTKSVIPWIRETLAI
jgi:truncated hemoglobin YjbI